MFARNSATVVSEAERIALEARSRSRSSSMSASDVRRAQLILMLAEGATWTAIGRRLGCSKTFIGRWRQRFQEGRLDRPLSSPPGAPAKPTGSTA